MNRQDGKDSPVSRLLITVALAWLLSQGRPALAGDCPGDWIAPTAVSYRSFEGETYQLWAWPGTHVAILTPDADRCGATMRDLIATYDAAYELYADATGREPNKYPPTLYQGRATIAVVPDGQTCGAACGYLGSTGIEWSRSQFESDYFFLQDDGCYAGTMFYELGRNFWFYRNQLEYLEEDQKWSNVTTTFAVFMSLEFVDTLGLTGCPFAGGDFASYRHARLTHVDRYTANPGLTWANAVRVEATGVPNTDLLASFLHRLQLVHGPAWMSKVWREAGLQPTRVTTQDAVDNMILAASAAAGANLCDVFETLWRWPVSPTARADAVARFGAPVAARPYDGTCGNGTLDPDEETDTCGGATTTTTLALGSSTTTTTTSTISTITIDEPPGSSTTTSSTTSTTTTTLPACATAVACLDAALGGPPCPGETIHPKLGALIAKKLGTARRLLVATRSATGERNIARLVERTRQQLDKVGVKCEAFATRRRRPISAECRDAILTTLNKVTHQIDANRLDQP